MFSAMRCKNNIEIDFWNMFKAVGEENTPTEGTNFVSLDLPFMLNNTQHSPVFLPSALPQ